MKREIADYVSRCLQCQQIKAIRQKPAGLLHPLPISRWKWEDIAMDYVIGFPRSNRGNNAILVIVDRLTKAAHFIPIKDKYAMNKMATTYIREII